MMMPGVGEGGGNGEWAGKWTLPHGQRTDTKYQSFLRRGEESDFVFAIHIPPHRSLSS